MSHKITLFAICLSILSCSFQASAQSDNPNKQGRRVERIINPVPYSQVLKSPPISYSMSSLNESFESTTFPPTGWTHAELTGGTGWNRQTVGTSPLPGWTGGTITSPPGGGSAVAYVTWIDGGATSNDLWLITPQITNVQLNDSLYFWLLKPGYTNGYLDNIDIKISTTTAIPSAFTITVAALVYPVGTSDTTWLRRGYRLGNFVTNGANIYIAFREHVNDNNIDGAAFLLDLVSVTSLVGVENNNNEIPASYGLQQNYPNPFNPSTQISYSIPKGGNVKLAVYDMVGNEVAIITNEFKKAGNYTINFDASRLSSGVYFYKLTSEGYSDVKKMILIK
jgi:type IX secretion system substrate protein